MPRQEDIALARARESFDRCLEHQATTGRGFAQAVYEGLFDRRPDARRAFGAAWGSAPGSAFDPRCSLDADEARIIEAAWRDVLRPGVEYMMRRNWGL